ncbi:MAG: hypothetical protein NVS9B10_31100 [Nevskia sp.]
MIGRSPAFARVQELTRRIAAYQAPVLIEGETGTGKELAARAIHYGSVRAGRPFVPVNCGALPDTLIENELFGHARGAFTDARQDQAGLVEIADGGSLFLDEVDSLSARGQVTLLRFLQDQQYRPLGSRRERRANVRVIAASNRDLDALVAAGGFRMDLLYRLRILHLLLPPLRERSGDAALLAEHFVRVAAERYGKAPRPLHAETLAWFDRYHWPGNIRELENLVCRNFLLGDGELLEIPAPSCLRETDLPAPLNYRCAKDRAIAEFEARFLSQAIAMAQGNVAAAARLIGTERRHLGRLLKKYGIEKPV